MRYFKYFLLASLFVGFGALIGAPSANAVSDYDTVIDTVQTLKMQNDDYNTPATEKYNNLKNYDFKYKWADFTLATVFDNPMVLNGTEYTVTIGTTSGATQADAVIAWRDKKNWSVSQFGAGGTEQRIAITYTTAENTSLEFNEPPGWGRKQLSFEQDISYTIVVQIGSASTIEVSYIKNNANSHTAIAYTGTYSRNPLFIFWDINYPTGYIGTTPPDSVPPPTIPLKYWVNFTFTNSTGDVQAKYSNYKTDPEPSYLPQPKTLWWHIYEGDTNVTDGTSVCDIDLRVDIPFNSSQHCQNFKPNPNKKYFLTTQVNPTTALNEDVFAPITQYNITFQRSVFSVDFSKPTVGSTEFCTPGAMSNVDSVFCAEPKQLDIAGCFSADFPYFQLDQCMTNFEIIFNYITFQSPRFPEWRHVAQCHSLNVMDEWLGLPNNYQVCPQIPDAVRSVVSPFVAFILGLVTVGFITKHNRDVN